MKQLYTEIPAMSLFDGAGAVTPIEAAEPPQAQEPETESVAVNEPTATTSSGTFESASSDTVNEDWEAETSDPEAVSGKDSVDTELPVTTTTVSGDLENDTETQENEISTDPPEANKNEIVFIVESSDPDGTLADDAKENGKQVVVIADDESGIDVITETLENSDELVDAIHLVSHGDDNLIDVGTDLITPTTLELYQDRMASWSTYMTDDADILIYGCEVSQTNQNMMAEISKITQADIASSDDVTGVNGDFDLENHIGNIDVDTAFSDEAILAFNHDLMSVVDTWTYDFIHTDGLQYRSVYMLVDNNDSLTYGQADSAARSMTYTTPDGSVVTGYLAHFTSDAELANANSNTTWREGNVTAFWLGGSDAQREGTWVFSGGDPLGEGGTTFYQADRDTEFSDSEFNSFGFAQTDGAGTDVNGATVPWNEGRPDNFTTDGVNNGVGEDYMAVWSDYSDGSRAGLINDTQFDGDPEATTPYRVDGYVVEFTYQVNRPPIAEDNAYTVGENQTITSNILTENTGSGVDRDLDSDTLSVTQINGSDVTDGQTVELPSGATVTINAAGIAEYDTNGAFEALGVGDTATDSYTYQIADGNGGTDTATVTYTITGENDPPVANDDGDHDGDGTVDDDAFCTEEDTPVTVTVLGNDTDIDGDDISISRFEQPENATVVLNDDGTFTITPDADFHGTLTFDYYVVDEHGLESVEPATVTVVIKPVNDAPEVTMPHEGEGGMGDCTTVAVEGGETVYPLEGIAVSDVDSSYQQDATITADAPFPDDLIIGFNDQAQALMDEFDLSVEIDADTIRITGEMPTEHWPALLGGMSLTNPNDGSNNQNTITLSLTVTVTDISETGMNDHLTGSTQTCVVVTDLNEPPVAAQVKTVPINEGEYVPRRHIHHDDAVMKLADTAKIAVTEDVVESHVHIHHLVNNDTLQLAAQTDDQSDVTLRPIYNLVDQFNPSIPTSLADQLRDINEATEAAFLIQEEQVQNTAFGTARPTNS